ncbi:hypothetical protein [Paracidovorax cattleyae]|uniref:hypothetical protein n=1 Tax=Paracidovorax cattleyae TaxID=80868 RepID=UPI0018AF9AF4|nr:hypothetical protein [Paracidovorax cattleyae]MBF9265988.1 hypothetical protein [Paracidovorax cattleyae]
MQDEDSAALAMHILDFLRGIGLPVREAPLPDGSFLPGVRIERGGLCDRAYILAWPGDLLHEAGHLAVVPAALRAGMDDALQDLPAVEHGGEIEATAWAWAASCHLGLDAAVLFHDGGYHGQGQSLRFTFGMGVYLGLPGLVAAGMALSSAQAAAQGGEPYPHMQVWLRP